VDLEFKNEIKDDVDKMLKKWQKEFLDLQLE
jgi:hypothetical protein